METTEMMNDLIQEAIQAASTIIHLPHRAEGPMVVNAPLIQPEMGVLVGMTGDIRGRLLLESPSQVFSAIANAMYGMPLEGEMLESFAGEIGNMIGGTISTGVSDKGISMDITPPTVLVGQTKISGFLKAHSISLQLDGVGELKIVLILEEK